MILPAAMASTLILPIFRRRFLTKARLNLKRAICGPCLHTDMSLAALDRLCNRHRPNCSDAARGSLPAGSVMRGGGSVLMRSTYGPEYPRTRGALMAWSEQHPAG